MKFEVCSWYQWPIFYKNISFKSGDNLLQGISTRSSAIRTLILELIRTIIMADGAQDAGEKVIWMLSCISFQRWPMRKFKFMEKIDLSITFGNATYYHVTYVADISDQFIIRLDFKNNKLYSRSEDTALFKIKTI